MDSRHLIQQKSIDSYSSYRFHHPYLSIFPCALGGGKDLPGSRPRPVLAVPKTAWAPFPLGFVRALGRNDLDAFRCTLSGITHLIVATVS